MGKIFSLIFVFLLAFPLTACGQSEVGETGTVPNHTGSEPTAGEETIVKAEVAEGIRESCLAIL